MTNDNEQPELIRVGGPLKRVRLTFQPVEPLDGPVTDGPLIRVGRPLKRIRLTFQPVPPVVTILELPLADGQKGAEVFARLNSVIQKVNEIETLNGRAGVWVDGSRSGVHEGTIAIVLAPNDLTDALDTCKRVADYLFAASRKPGVTVKVFAADQPETPVYELAA